MLKQICRLSHRYSAMFQDLKDSQAADGRHKCAACAFEKGFHDGVNGSYNYTSIVELLPYSQAGSVRHKDPYEACKLGFQCGVAMQDMAIVNN